MFFDGSFMDVIWYDLGRPERALALKGKGERKGKGSVRIVVIAVIDAMCLRLIHSNNIRKRDRSEYYPVLIFRETIHRLAIPVIVSWKI